MKGFTVFVGILGLLLGAGTASAEYPERTINMLVPFGAGGGTDVPARFFAAEMENILGQNIVVSNVEGAGGTVGATQLSQSAADGYNLGFLPVGTDDHAATSEKDQLQRGQLDADLHGQPGPVLSRGRKRQPDRVRG